MVAPEEPRGRAVRAAGSARARSTCRKRRDFLSDKKSLEMRRDFLQSRKSTPRINTTGLLAEPRHFLHSARSVWGVLKKNTTPSLTYHV